MCFYCIGADMRCARRSVVLPPFDGSLFQESRVCKCCISVCTGPCKLTNCTTVRLLEAKKGSDGEGAKDAQNEDTVGVISQSIRDCVRHEGEEHYSTSAEIQHASHMYINTLTHLQAHVFARLYIYLLNTHIDIQTMHT